MKPRRAKNINSLHESYPTFRKVRERDEGVGEGERNLRNVLKALIARA